MYFTQVRHLVLYISPSLYLLCISLKYEIWYFISLPLSIYYVFHSSTISGTWSLPLSLYVVRYTVLITLIINAFLNPFLLQCSKFRINGRGKIVTLLSSCGCSLIMYWSPYIRNTSIILLMLCSVICWVD